MTGRRPLVVVSLPARSIDEALVQAEIARTTGADIAEVRLDRFPAPELDRLEALFPSALPLLATLRSRAEGGEGPDDPARRAEHLLNFVRWPFRWLDLELDRDLPTAVRLPPVAEVGRVVSCHLGPSSESDWARRFLELAAADGIGKLIVPASVAVALEEIIPRLDRYGATTVSVHTTGPSGPLLRALAGRLGLPLVFAALPEDPGRPPVEPSQIPVDRLRPFLDAEDRPPLFALVGRPVSHSGSPAIHARWMRDARRQGLYLPLEIADRAELERSIPLLAARGFRGMNVTHPYKVAAYELADDRGPGASACRAANCLTFRDGGVDAENTDLAAILRRLRELKEAGRWDGAALTVIGGGAAARATLAAAAAISAEATIRVRRPEAASVLRKEYPQASDGSEPDRPAALVVHATNVGRGGSVPLEVPIRPLLGPGTIVLDWVYRPDDSTIQREAERAGATYEDGWRLLVYQAAASFAIWWGSEPDPTSVTPVLQEGGCAA